MVQYTVQMQPLSVKKYLQILRFQSLMYVLQTSQEENRLGGEGCRTSKRENMPGWKGKANHMATSVKTEISVRLGSTMFCL